MSELELPTLKIRATGPLCFGSEIEMTLGDVDLIALGCVTDLTLKMGGDEIHTATITVECIPDIELPAGVTLNLEAAKA